MSTAQTFLARAIRASSPWRQPVTSALPIASLRALHASTSRATEEEGQDPPGKKPNIRQVNAPQESRFTTRSAESGLLPDQPSVADVKAAGEGRKEEHAEGDSGELVQHIPRFDTGVIRYDATFPLAQRPGKEHARRWMEDPEGMLAEAVAKQAMRLRRRKAARRFLLLNALRRKAVRPRRAAYRVIRSDEAPRASIAKHAPSTTHFGIRFHLSDDSRRKVERRRRAEATLARTARRRAAAARSAPGSGGNERPEQQSLLLGPRTGRFRRRKRKSREKGEPHSHGKTREWGHWALEDFQRRTDDPAAAAALELWQDLAKEHRALSDRIKVLRGMQPGCYEVHVWRFRTPLSLAGLSGARASLFASGPSIRGSWAIEALAQRAGDPAAAAAVRDCARRWHWIQTKRSILNHIGSQWTEDATQNSDMSKVPTQDDLLQKELLQDGPSKMVRLKNDTSIRVQNQEAPSGDGLQQVDPAVGGSQRGGERIFRSFEGRTDDTAAAEAIKLIKWLQRKLKRVSAVLLEFESRRPGTVPWNGGREGELPGPVNPALDEQVPAFVTTDLAKRTEDPVAVATASRICHLLSCVHHMRKRIAELAAVEAAERESTIRTPRGSTSGRPRGALSRVSKSESPDRPKLVPPRYAGQSAAPQKHAQPDAHAALVDRLEREKHELQGELVNKLEREQRELRQKLVERLEREVQELRERVHAIEDRRVGVDEGALPPLPSSPGRTHNAVAVASGPLPAPETAIKPDVAWDLKGLKEQIALRKLGMKAALAIARNLAARSFPGSAAQRKALASHWESEVHELYHAAHRDNPKSIVSTRKWLESRALRVQRKGASPLSPGKDQPSEDADGVLQIGSGSDGVTAPPGTSTTPSTAPPTPSAAPPAPRGTPPEPLITPPAPLATPALPATSSAPPATPPVPSPTLPALQATPSAPPATPPTPLAAVPEPPVTPPALPAIPPASPVTSPCGPQAALGAPPALPIRYLPPSYASPAATVGPPPLPTTLSAPPQTLPSPSSTLSAPPTTLRQARPDGLPIWLQDEIKQCKIGFKRALEHCTRLARRRYPNSPYDRDALVQHWTHEVDELYYRAHTSEAESTVVPGGPIRKTLAKDNPRYQDAQPAPYRHQIDPVADSKQAPVKQPPASLSVSRFGCHLRGNTSGETFYGDEYWQDREALFECGADAAAGGSGATQVEAPFTRRRDTLHRDILHRDKLQRDAMQRDTPEPRLPQYSAESNAPTSDFMARAQQRLDTRHKKAAEQEDRQTAAAEDSHENIDITRSFQGLRGNKTEMRILGRMLQGTRQRLGEHRPAHIELCPEADWAMNPGVGVDPGQTLCTYSWAQVPEPTIQVPGGAPRLCRVELPQPLPAPTGTPILREDQLHGSALPFAPLFAALRHAVPPAAPPPLADVDVVADIRVLGLLLGFVRGPPSMAFRVNVALLRNTLTLALVQPDHRRSEARQWELDEKTAFRDLITAPAPGLVAPGLTVRAVKYRLGPLVVVARHEVHASLGLRGDAPVSLDAPARNPHSAPPDPSERPAAAQTPGAGRPGSPLPRVLHRGPSTPGDAHTPLHVTARMQGMRKDEGSALRQTNVIMMQAYLSRMSFFASGEWDFPSDAPRRVTEVRLRHFGALLAAWEATPDARDWLRRLVTLLRQLQSVARQRPDGRCALVYWPNEGENDRKGKGPAMKVLARDDKTQSESVPETVVEELWGPPKAEKEESRSDVMVPIRRWNSDRAKFRGERVLRVNNVDSMTSASTGG